MPTRCKQLTARVMALGLTVVSGACSARTPSLPTARSTAQPIVTVMGPSRLGAAQLVEWFGRRKPQPSGVYAASVAVDTLAQYFIEEGAAEGVAGDVAFMQSIVETGWFRFAGTVPAWANNFAGLGARDADPAPAAFSDARTGVRAQVQHLRAYADPSAHACTVPPLRNPCVDPRFHLVVPKGRAPTWNQMGNGNWASSPTYATAILRLYFEALELHLIR